MTFKKIVSSVLALSMTFALTACGDPAKSGAASANGNYILATGGTSGTYYPLGGVLSQMINKNVADVNITPNATGASRDNIILMADNEAQLGIVQNDVLLYSKQGVESFKNDPIEGISTLATLYPEVVQLVVGANSGISSVADLKGKRVSVGDMGSGVEANAKQFFEAYGLSFADIKVSNLSFKESATAFKDKQIDAFFVTAGVPNPAIVELTVQNPVKVLSLDDTVMDKLIEKYPFYTKYVVGKDVYKTDADSNTLAVSAQLIVRLDMPEDIVYNMAKAIFENLPEVAEMHAKGTEMSLENAVQGIAVDLHPGALKYFQEKGVIK